MLRFLAARCGNPDEAEDIFQELWIKAAGHPSGPVANPRAYLFRMANNLVLDRRRGERRAMTRDRAWLVEEGGGAALPEDRPDLSEPADVAIARQQEEQVLHRAIATLPPGARTALVLHRLQGHPQGEVATIMGISRSGVEKHLALAMRHLRNSLTDCGFFEAAASSDQKRRKGESAVRESGS